MSSFANPEIISLLNEKFVPATDDDWYNRRRKDAAGEFFMKVAMQGPRGKGNGTKQGHYIITPSGKLLGFNNNRSVERRMAFIRDALAKWEALPAAERKPGAVKVAPLGSARTDKNFQADPPADGVVLAAAARILKAGDGGKMEHCGAEDSPRGWGHLTAVDHMWIQKSEWDELIAAGKKGGDMPPRIAYRLLRSHLIDFTRGEPPFWKHGEVRSHKLSISPLGKPGHFKVEGEALLATDADPAKADRGYQVKLLGKIETDASGKATKFDLVALGDHWGEGTYTRGARPGRNPLGIAFSLVDPKDHAATVRPQNSRWLQGYWEAERG